MLYIRQLYKVYESTLIQNYLIHLFLWESILLLSPCTFKIEQEKGSTCQKLYYYDFKTLIINTHGSEHFSSWFPEWKYLWKTTHIVYIKRHTRYSTYALPKCSICAQGLSYGCWGRYNFLIYLFSCLSEFYRIQYFCTSCLFFLKSIGHFICDIQILNPINF